MQQILEVKTPKGVSGLKGAKQAIRLPETIKGASMNLSDYYMAKQAAAINPAKLIAGATKAGLKSGEMGWSAAGKQLGKGKVTGAWNALSGGQKAIAAGTGAGAAGLMLGKSGS